MWIRLDSLVVLEMYRVQDLPTGQGITPDTDMNPPTDTTLLSVHGRAMPAVNSMSVTINSAMPREAAV